MDFVSLLISATKEARQEPFRRRGDDIEVGISTEGYGAATAKEGKRNEITERRKQSLAARGEDQWPHASGCPVSPALPQERRMRASAQPPSRSFLDFGYHHLLTINALFTLAKCVRSVFQQCIGC